jgi:hypothetical protein
MAMACFFRLSQEGKMGAIGRIGFVVLLSAALVMIFSPVPIGEALAAGPSGHGGGGGGGHGGGFSGGGGYHGGGGGFHGGGHMGGWSSGRVGGLSAGHVGGMSVGHFDGGHINNWSGGHAMYSYHPQFGHVAPKVAGPSHSAVHSFAGQPGTWNQAGAWNHAGTWNHAGNSNYPGAWNHAGTWNHSLAANRGVWNHSESLWNHHEPDRDDFLRFGGFGFGGFGWPWYGFGWGWPGYYDYGYAPYYSDYGYTPYAGLYGNDYGAGVVPYAYDLYDNAATAPYATVSPASSATVIETGPPQAGSEAADFYTRALADFRQGEYRDALRLAGHAAIDDPRNPDIHLLGMLGLFALGEYRGAAVEAHVVADIGAVPDWHTLYGFYQNAGPYTEQLRKLEMFVEDRPSAAEGRFLLGFLYMTQGHNDAAKDQFTEAVKLTPQDALAARLLKQLGGTVPAGVPNQTFDERSAERQAAARGPGALR